MIYTYYTCILRICNCCFKKGFWHSDLEWNNSFKSSNRRQICADMLKPSWCFIFPVTGMTQLRFFVAVTINPWTVLLDQSQKGPRFKVASLQKLGHSASVVVVISMRVQYILEVIEDPIIWNVSFSLNWGEGKNVQVHLLFCEMFIWWCYFASMRFPRLTKGIYLVAFFVVSFTKVRALATYMKCLDPSWSACRCRIGWSVLSHLDLSKGGSEKGQVVWNQVLLMARHGAKRSRYIGSSQQVAPLRMFSWLSCEVPPATQTMLDEMMAYFIRVDPAPSEQIFATRCKYLGFTLRT